MAKDDGEQMMILRSILLWAAALSIGFGSGFYTATQFAKADKLEALETQNERHEQTISALKRESIASVRRTIQQAREIASIDAEITSVVLRELEDENAKANRVERELSKLHKVVVHQQACSDIGNAHLSNAAVWLLNDARAPSGANNPGGEAAVRASAKVSDDSGQTPSTITVRRELIEHASCATEYNKLMNRHNALIDRLEKVNAKK